MKTNPKQPWFTPEFQGGAFDACEYCQFVDHVVNRQPIIFRGPECPWV